MYKLHNKKNAPVKMKNGEDFTYTVYWTARIAKRLLEAKRGERLRIVEY